MYRKLIAFLLSAFAALSSFFGVGYSDTYTPGDFPIIEPTQKAQDAVRIMSFNIRCADVAGTIASRRRLVALEEILRIAPDSLGLQEVTAEWMAYLCTIPEYGVVGKFRDGIRLGEANPILYNREKYKLIDHDTFWLSETPEKVSLGWDAACRRVCTWALLENRESGKRYVHLNSHFDHMGREAVRESARMITSFIAERFGDLPAVFTADMNTTPESEAYRIMTASLTDTRLAAGDSVFLPTTFHDGQPEAWPDELIDYVLCSEAVTPLVYRTVTDGVNGRYVSDHFPIYADVQF